MQKQTYDGKVKWLIVDDGEIEQKTTFQRNNWELQTIRPSHRWKQGANTQQKNLIAGLKEVSHNDKLVIIEDDDYYSPEYLENVNKWLDDCNLVGESAARYYNVKSKKYRQLSNFFHASLCSTGMKSSAIDYFKAVCLTNNHLIDMTLWKKYDGSKRLYRSNLVVGLKGMVGRAGIGVGHKNDFIGDIDKDGSVLKKWLNDDVSLYA